jgi:hypothetical protein
VARISLYQIRLLSLDTFLQEEPNSSVSVNDRIPKSLVKLAHKCHNYRTENEGIAHLLLGYKDCGCK